MQLKAKKQSLQAQALRREAWGRIGFELNAKYGRRETSKIKDQ